MSALGRMPPPAGISAMQSINVTILNPVFFAVFFGTALMSIVLIAGALAGWSDMSAAALLAGGVLYLAGCMAVTMVFNVPLNNALAATAADSAEGAVIWSRYLAEWVPWNHVRTVACLASCAAFIQALR
jgi:uncharacterized membrane protein